MAWRLAASLRVYIDQINRLAPNRSRASDGTIGDEAHQQSSSDHNPRVIPGLGATPVVTAADITHDPANGCDFGKFAERLRLSRDSRIKYVIFNRRMFSWYASGGYPAWTWRPYTGSNPHVHHGHLSVVADLRADRAQAWILTSEGVTTMTLPVPQYHLDRIAAGYDQIVAANKRIDELKLALAAEDKETDASAKIVEDIAAEQARLMAAVAELATRPPVVITTEMLVAALKDPQVAAVLAEAAFQGAQRSELE